MFDLEQAIAGWRQQMLAAGIQTPVPLEELEIHLREEIERQLQSDNSVQKVFENSVQKIGQPNALKKEFAKSERNIMKRIAIIALGIFGILLGPGFILPALAKYRNLGIWTGEQMIFCLLGVAIAIVGIGAVIFGFKKRNA